MENNILKRFPKRRQPLDEELKNIYKEIYINNRNGLGIGNKISQKLETWGHKITEKRAKQIICKNSLEIGAGNFNHLKYMNSDSIYEAIEPNSWFYKDKNYNLNFKIYKDISDISKDRSYDRIFSIFVLEHIEDLVNLISNSHKLLNKGGLFQAVVPCEGELSWYLGWRFGTGIPFYLKHKLDWGKMIRHEHVNTFEEIQYVIKYHFENLKIIRSPLPFFLRMKHLSFHAYVEAIK
jgi:hypothetical protein